MAKRVVLGMSGGVDSSVAALLLKNEGYEVIGITFKMLPDFDSSDAEKVAKNLGIEFHVEDIEDDFNDTIIKNFLDSYKMGLTPNPCVLCNRKIKFKYMEDMRIKYNADFIATGHYAKIIDGKVYKSSDLNKDQTYFLSNVNKDIFKRVIFPLEGIDKTEVRRIAEENNLIVAKKKDSYDVCFITDKFRDYMSSHVDNKPGDIVLVDTGKVVGKHIGLMNYTIGQRKGLDIGGMPDRTFVVGKNLEKNILYITLGDSSDYLISDSCIVDNVNLLVDELPLKCMARFRYRQKDVPVKIEKIDDKKIKVIYDGVKAVTPGQTCTLYLDDLCLGGGIIKDVMKDDKKLWYL